MVLFLCFQQKQRKFGAELSATGSNGTKMSELCASLQLIICLDHLDSIRAMKNKLLYSLYSSFSGDDPTPVLFVIAIIWLLIIWHLIISRLMFFVFIFWWQVTMEKVLLRRAANLVLGRQGNHGPQAAGWPRFAFGVLPPPPLANQQPLNSGFAVPIFAETLD